MGGLDHFRFDSFAFGRADAIDEQDSMEVIVLVLNRTRQESTSLELQHLAIQRLGFYADSRGPGHVAPHPREAQATLNAGFRLSESLYFGVDKHQGHMRADLDGLAANPQRTWSILHGFNVDDAKLNGQTHLLSRQTDSFRGIHRLKHFFRQSTDASVYLLYSPSFGTQRRMAVWDDVQGHNLQYGAGRWVSNLPNRLIGVPRAA